MNKKIIGGLAAVGVLASGLIGAGIGDLADNSEDIIVDLQARVAEANKTINAQNETIVELSEQEPEVITKTVNNTVEVEVDNGNLHAVVEDYEGDELNDDEVQEIVDEVLFKNDVMALAEKMVEAEIVDYMDDEDMFGAGLLDGYRDDDVYDVIIDTDDTIISDVDFDDKDATVVVEAKVKMEEDDEKARAKVLAEVAVRDGDLRIVNATVVLVE